MATTTTMTRRTSTATTRLQIQTKNKNLISVSCAVGEIENGIDFKTKLDYGRRAWANPFSSARGNHAQDLLNRGGKYFDEIWSLTNFVQRDAVEAMRCGETHKKPRAKETYRRTNIPNNHKITLPDTILLVLMTRNESCNTLLYLSCSTKIQQ